MRRLFWLLILIAVSTLTACAGSRATPEEEEQLVVYKYRDDGKVIGSIMHPSGSVYAVCKNDGRLVLESVWNPSQPNPKAILAPEGFTFENNVNAASPTFVLCGQKAAEAVEAMVRIAKLAEQNEVLLERLRARQ